MTERLLIDSLRVRRGGQTVLEIDSLHVAGGELVVISGDAGSGKTTFAAALCGAIDAAGLIAVDGKPLAGPPSLRRRAGLACAFRDGERIAGCTVAEALHLGAAAGRAGEALDRFPQLGTRRHIAAHLLSGGEQQLLQVACAWAARPIVLVLDSPTVGLADDAASTLTALAREEVERGATVLWFEADRRAAPDPPRYRLVRGSLELVGESATAPE
ncbi:MAG TPA: ATP-binding cassette domain-containing protein [Candidatus Acidoferrales bacterium]|jgi:branched-chain amino acid transport system ATP-binding protein|nr:ATP-binding cassette domain-containing protein [Candidatus Acidoferrales bacterium]